MVGIFLPSTEFCTHVNSSNKTISQDDEIFNLDTSLKMFNELYPELSVLVVVVSVLDY